MSGLAKSSFAFEGLAAAAIEDRGVVGYFLAVTLCNEVADMSVHVLSLLGSSSLAGADSPYGFVSKDDFAEVLGRQMEESLFNLLLYYLVVRTVLTLGKAPRRCRK